MKNVLIIIGALVILAALIFTLQSQNIINLNWNNLSKTDNGENQNTDTESVNYEELSDQHALNMTSFNEEIDAGAAMVRFVDTTKGLKFNVFMDSAQNSAENEVKIYSGSCSQLGEARHTLTQLRNGESETFLKDISLGDLYAEPMSIAINSESGEVLYCSEII